MQNDLPSVNVNIDIPFYDIDAMNVVWHGNYVKYLEVARCELLRSFHYDYLEMLESGYTWPIVDMRIKYVGSAKFSRKINVNAKLKEYENRLKIAYIITDLASTEVLTKASTIQVAIDLASGEMLFASPTILLEKLGVEG